MKKNIKNYTMQLCYIGFCTLTTLIYTAEPVLGATIWEKAAIALLMMNFSRSGRTVDESRAWLKRIIITWAIINGLGFIMAYITPFFEGGQWTA